MSNFPSYMALGASAATYSRVANLEYAITQLTDALINELAAIGETLTDSLAVQQELLNREVFQSNIEEFIYQLEKSVQEAEYSKSGESPVTYFFRLSYFLHTVDQEQINTSIIKGRENKAAFDRAVSTALKLCNSLRTNGEVIAAIDQIELEESRRRVLREEELRRKKRARRIAIVLITSFLLIYPIYLLLESPRMRAYLGSVTAQKTLAQKYYDGQGVVRDYQESLKWFQKAADQGDKDAQYELGKWYYSGVWVTRDYAEAFKWFQRAADQGDMDAQYQLGRLYYRGEGVSQDYPEALKWFQKAAEQGNIEAQRLKDSLSQFMDMQKKAEQGVANAQFELSHMYYSGEFVSKNNTEAFKWLQKAAEQADKDAQLRLGQMYYRGEGVSQDYPEALKWFQKAAEQGNEEALKQTTLLSSFLTAKEKAEQGDKDAQYQLGLAYKTGEGVTQDYSNALKWFQKAAEQGYAGAQHNMGAMYYNGWGISQDYSKAFYWASKAAKQGYAGAQYFMGVLYFIGEGLIQDYPNALKWFKKAAEQGHTEAQHNIGAMYYNGYGVSKDRNKAVSWLCKAAAQGYQDSIKNLKEMGETCGR
jgi:TPR repeat protein